VTWDAATQTLSGTARVIGGEPFHIAIAHNGATPAPAAASTAGGTTHLVSHPATGLGTLVLTAEKTTAVKWSVKYQ
jgi:hypothetical protein